MTRILASDLQGLRERSDDLPAFEKFAWVPPLDFLNVCSPRASSAAAFVTSSSLAPLLDGLLGISLIVHSRIGVRFLYSPSFILVFLFRRGNPV